MDNLQKLMDDILEWSSKTFKDENAYSKLHHLKKEISELVETKVESAYHGPENVSIRHEYADCFMLLIGAAKLDGFSANDLISATFEKLEICKSRKWSEPDENGIVEHVR
jgi:uncharacterized protein YaaR (DUF327 family)